MFPVKMRRCVKVIEIRKHKIKIFLFADDMIIYVEALKNSLKK